MGRNSRVYFLPCVSPTAPESLLSCECESPESAAVSAQDLYEKIAVKDVQDAADILRPAFTVHLLSGFSSFGILSAAVAMVSCPFNTFRIQSVPHVRVNDSRPHPLQWRQSSRGAAGAVPPARYLAGPGHIEAPRLFHFAVASCALAASTTWSVVNPNCFCSTFSGADAPNVFIPKIAPSIPV
jgi:hypothetical protein